MLSVNFICVGFNWMQLLYRDGSSVTVVLAFIPIRPIAFAS